MAIGRTGNRYAILAVILAVVLAAAMLLIPGRGPTVPSAVSFAKPAPAVVATSPTPPTAEAARLFQEISKELAAVSPPSRKVLLGERDPNGASCVKPFPKGTLDKGPPAPPKGDPKGGPGTRLLNLYCWGYASKSPTDDFAWHQGEFRKTLEQMLAESRAASALIKPLAEKTARLSEGLRGLKSWPSGPGWPAAPLGVDELADWPTVCRQQLSAALAESDLAEAQRWAGELEAAVFALADLHRWLEFLLENQLASLDFQARCESLFVASDKIFSADEPYERKADISRFPAGSLGTQNLANYLEVEHQAENWFRAGKDYLTAVEAVPVETKSGAAIWLPPDVRASFMKVRERLSPEKQALWDAAAHQPFERSFLANQLWRAQAANVIDALGEVLVRFDKAHPSGATVADLMDVIVYRAGLGMAGGEWGDRYDARLMEAATRLEGKNRRDLLVAAHKFAWSIYGGSDNYQPLVLTLRK